MAHPTPTAAPTTTPEPTLTREQIDQAAAQQLAANDAAGVDEHTRVDPETTLAYGATGPCVEKLVGLLALAGHLTAVEAKHPDPVLDEQLLADVAAAQATLEVSEPELTTPQEIPVGVKGHLVGQATWTALYAAAEASLEQAAQARAAQTSLTPAATSADDTNPTSDHGAAEVSQA